MRKALIAWGGWEGHEPEAGAARVAAILAGEGFAVTTRQGSEAFADPGLAGFSLIVPILTMSTIAKDALANLLAAVEGGVGLGGYHGGMADAFRNEPDYQFMVGGQWVAHPGNVIDYRVDVTRPDDPVMAGIPARFPYRSEQYYLHVDPRVRGARHHHLLRRARPLDRGRRGAAGLEDPLRPRPRLLQRPRPRGGRVRRPRDVHHPPPRPALGVPRPNRNQEEARRLSRPSRPTCPAYGRGASRGLAALRRPVR